VTNGIIQMAEHLSYKKSGVNIDLADATKREMAKCIDFGDPRVLNRLGAFASLVEGDFSILDHPVLVLKTEEPGSKQKLAFQYGRISSICYDLIHHLINDIIVMGAKPLYVQDCIICGKIEPDIVKELVSSMADACRQQNCVLVGGETSEQPGVVDSGLYILSASIVGVVEKQQIIDGSRIAEDDIILAAASNGLHTNGYSLIRTLIDKKPSILKKKIGNQSFLDAIMCPHKCYNIELREFRLLSEIKGIAHITGGGIGGNLNRILPQTLNANIDLNKIRIPDLFKIIRNYGKVRDSDMLRTFNMGVGLVIVVNELLGKEVQSHFARHGVECYSIGTVTKGFGKVNYSGRLSW
jgi:phosphoribosylformylglycinamidine cyclo-ligase